MERLKTITRLVILALAAVTALQVFSSAASAACPATNPVAALITAINDANTDSKANSHPINLFPQSYTLSADCQLPPIASKITINGNGAAIDGNHLYPVFFT